MTSLRTLTLLSVLATLSACHNMRDGTDAQRPQNSDWVPERFNSDGDRGGGGGNGDAVGDDDGAQANQRPGFTIHQRASVHASVSSVVLENRSSGGQRPQGHVGMDGMVCEFEDNGQLGLDTFTPGHTRPDVHDAKDYGDDTVVLASNGSQLMLLSHGQVFASAPFPRVTQAALTRDSVVAIGDCQLKWFDDSAHTVTLDGPRCRDARMAYDLGRDRVFLAAGGEVMEIDKRGHRSIGGQASDLVLNAQTQTLLLVEPGGDRLTAMSVSGDLKWSVRLPEAASGERVLSIADMGDELGFAISTSGPMPALYLVDADRGDLLGEWALSEAGPVSVSPDGRTLAILRNRVTAVFDLN